jgi:large subunit ribosomal protein L21
MSEHQRGHSPSPKDEMPVFEQYAIFQTGGKQYQAIPGKTVEIEKLEGDAGSLVEFTEVLLRKTDGKNVQIGQPYVGTPVKASIIKHMRGPKLIVFKFKRRKKVRVKKGHRQPHTVIRIESI